MGPSSKLANYKSCTKWGTTQKELIRRNDYCHACTELRTTNQLHVHKFEHIKVYLLL